jgi:predicted aconitase with swiveling domain
VAIINVETEPVIGGGCFLAGMLYGKPIVVVDRLDRNPCEVIKNGDYVHVNGDSGVVEILKRG